MIRRISLVATLFLANVCGVGRIQAENLEAKWKMRVLTGLEECLANEKLSVLERAAAVEQGCLALAAAGDAAESVDLATRLLPVERRDLCVTLIASVLSERDHVAAALETADALNDQDVRQRAILLICARQAQRGDFDDAMDIFRQLSIPKHRGRALELVLDARLERRKDDDVQPLLNLASDPELRDTMKRRIQQVRERPTLDDADYVDRTVRLAKDSFGFLGFGEADEEFWRRKCRAEFVTHRRDAKSIRAALDDLHQLAAMAAHGPRRRVLRSVGDLARKAGDQHLAEIAFRALLDDYLVEAESGQSDDLLPLRVGSDDGLSQAAQTLSEDEIACWLERCRFVEGAAGASLRQHVFAAVAAAVARLGREKQADDVYVRCQNCRERFEISAAVLNSLSQGAGGSP